MSSELIQIVVLAAVALFLVLKLRSVLGTRSGFEKTDVPRPVPGAPQPRPRVIAEIAGDVEDTDIAAHAEPGSDTARALAEIKRIEPEFSVGEFVSGARQAYEMIVSAFENGEVGRIAALLSPEVREGFEAAVAGRKAKGLSVEARFIGVRSAEVAGARLDPKTRAAEITLRFVGELSSVVKDATGAIVEGDPAAIRRQTDIFTFERVAGSSDPNWVLVSTGE